MKILDSIWFNNIGIVLGIDEVTKEKKAYIGIGQGIRQVEDENYIASHGYKFPLQCAILLMGGN